MRRISVLKSNTFHVAKLRFVSPIPVPPLFVHRVCGSIAWEPQHAPVASILSGQWPLRSAV